jgi:hypothetical protein
MSELQALQDMYGPEDLDPELVPYLGVGPLGRGLFHPLFHDPMYVELKNRIINRVFRHKVEKLEEFVREKKWHLFVFMHERPYRLDALHTVIYEHGVVEPEQVWPLVGSIWTDSENIWQNYDAWRDIWSLDDEDNTFVIENRHLVMSEEERAMLAAMPETLEVYRGCRDHELNGEGMSWTLDRDRAVRFARAYRRDDDTPVVIVGKAKKADVLAHFIGRNEREIVVFPEYISVSHMEEV